MLKILGLRSWNFHADNLDEMTKFYRDVLGAELRATQTIGGVNVARLRLGGTGLDFSTPPRSASKVFRITPLTSKAQVTRKSW